MNLGEDRLYTLSYPNLEVKKSLTENLLRYLTGSAAEQTRNRINLYRCLAAGDMDRLRDIFHYFGVFQAISSLWFTALAIAGKSYPL
ncbi:MAG: hypothetical protein ACP5J5_08200, partial [Dissulfurimicrobium sp.]